jgi:hypothetical protein
VQVGSGKLGTQELKETWRRPPDICATIFVTDGNNRTLAQALPMNRFLKLGIFREGSWLSRSFQRGEVGAENLGRNTRR